MKEIYNFFRPKFILIRIGPRRYGDSDVSTATKNLAEDVRDAVRTLRRHGFMVSEENENENLCDRSLKISDFRKMEKNDVENEVENTKNKNKIQNDPIQRNLKLKNTEKLEMSSASYLNKKFVCVWGTRLNEFEFSGKKWGKW